MYMYMYTYIYIYIYIYPSVYDGHAGPQKSVRLDALRQTP